MANRVLRAHTDRGETAVLACSALKYTCRKQLRVSDQVQFIYLEGTFGPIWQRKKQRANHYMQPGMLHSQFETLEPPTEDNAITISIDQTIDTIANLAEKSIRHGR